MRHKLSRWIARDLWLLVGLLIGGAWVGHADAQFYIRSGTSNTYTTACTGPIVKQNVTGTCASFGTGAWGATGKANAYYGGTWSAFGNGNGSDLPCSGVGVANAAYYRTFSSGGGTTVRHWLCRNGTALSEPPTCTAPQLWDTTAQECVEPPEGGGMTCTEEAPCPVVITNTAGTPVMTSTVVPTSEPPVVAADLAALPTIGLIFLAFVLGYGFGTVIKLVRGGLAGWLQ